MKAKTTRSASGDNGFIKKIPRYPQGLIDKMTQGIRIFIGLIRQESIALTTLNRVCDKVLLHDWQEHGVQEPEMTPTNLPYADKRSYRDAMSPVLKITKTGQSFQVGDFESHAVSDKTTSGQDVLVLLQQLMEQLYPSNPACS